MQVKSIAEILLTFIKLLFAIKTFVLSISKWLLKSGFTVDEVFDCWLDLEDGQGKKKMGH